MCVKRCKTSISGNGCKRVRQNVCYRIALDQFEKCTEKTLKRPESLEVGMGGNGSNQKLIHLIASNNWL